MFQFFYTVKNSYERSPLTHSPGATLVESNFVSWKKNIAIAHSNRPMYLMRILHESELDICEQD